MKIRLKRAYDDPAPADGFRVLVERLWPRGVSKQSARLDLWLRDAAPSSELRRWFDHRPERWEEFKRRYFAELDDRPESLEPLLEQLQRRAGKAVTFVFAAREQELNNAVALKEYVEREVARRRGGR